MVAKKKKKRPTRAIEAELEDADNTVDSKKEEEEDEKLDMQNLKISVKTVEQLLELAYEGQEVFTEVEYIRQDTSEIVAVATSDGTNSIVFRIDPSEWAYEIAAGLYENLEGEGQDPERVNPIEDGYEFITL